ncbi:hypothetical protein H6F98_29060 [Microcoleus sp. FACHB-SPT15]|uniref:hypothetical protein n=1 Tax=Microcoleus sp. FACHB-SPT15 TaxID=2692830 RepID=UPI0017816DB4|nr:hypothetical protein [Microcoleus sp. FACHB-SPT15]MBD1809475.1 hypothetical protein [Microcoleus sp. FACHB-SPT15]
MQYILQNTKRLISICLVTLLLVTSTLLSFPAPARAAGDVVIFKCETNCGNMAAFTAGVISGSAVTVAATGGGNVMAAAGMTAIGQVATTVAAPLAAVAAPIVVPVAATAAVGYGAYQLWDSYQKSQAQPSK